MLAKGDMPLSRIDAICRVLKLDFAELAQRMADMQPLLAKLTAAQETAVVADKKLLLAAICVLSQWTLEQITASYRLSTAECIQYLAQLDRIGIIELKPLNCYRLKMAKTFRWRPHGPGINYFRDHALPDYFSGGFDSAGEGLLRPCEVGSLRHFQRCGGKLVAKSQRLVTLVSHFFMTPWCLPRVPLTIVLYVLPNKTVGKQLSK